jgi:hypothetical protein
VTTPSTNHVSVRVGGDRAYRARPLWWDFFCPFAFGELVSDSHHEAYLREGAAMILLKVFLLLSISGLIVAAVVDFAEQVGELTALTIGGPLR